MECPELNINVGEVLGVTKVTISGRMDAWHDSAVNAVLSGYRDRGENSIVLDIVGLTFTGASSAMSLVNSLRMVGPEMSVHVISDGCMRDVMSNVSFGPGIKQYNSLDEIAESVNVDDEYYTSRWIGMYIDEMELPMAA